MNEELEKELMRLNKLWCNYKTHLKYCPNEITKQEKQGFIIFDYFDKLKVELSKTQQENQQLKNEVFGLNDRLSCANEELDLYKSVLNEVREYLDKNKKVASSHFNGKEYEYISYCLICDPNNLYEILDKVGDK